MRTLLILSIFFLCQYKAMAQITVLDSMRELIQQSKNDTIWLENRMQYAIELAKTDLAGAIQEVSAVKEEANRLNYPFYYARSFQILGAIYYDRGDYIHTIAADEEAETLLRKLPVSRRVTFGLATAYNDLGASYSLINDMEKAQSYYTQSADILQELGDSATLMITYFNIAFLYIDMQEWQKALEYFEKAMQRQPQKADNNSVQLYSRAAAMHFRLGNIKSGKRLLDSCNAHFLPFATEGRAWNYYHNALGEYYYATGNAEKALGSFKSAYAYGLSWKDPYYIADDSWEIGRSFLLLNKPDSAGKYLQMALDTAVRYNYLPKVRFILNEWGHYYDRVGNFRKANELRTQLLHFTDSLISVQNHNRILLFDARYNSRQKESQIHQLQKDRDIRDLQIRQKNILNYILMGCAFTAILFSILLYRYYRQQKKLQLLRISELETQQQLAATEAVLKGEEQERTRLAKDLHDGLGGLLSGIKYSFQTMKGNLIMTPENQQAFERGLAMLDNSIQEMRRVAHNMMPEALVKFGLDTALRDFCAGINQSGVLKTTYQSIDLEDPPINQTTAIIIYRIVQELINNTIKHAEAKNAIVQLIRVGTRLSLTVEDDGKGFDTGILKATHGIGWSNIQHRVEFLKGKMDVHSLPGKGVSVLIEFDA